MTYYDLMGPESRAVLDSLGVRFYYIATNRETGLVTARWAVGGVSHEIVVLRGQVIERGGVAGWDWITRRALNFVGTNKKEAQ